MIDLVAIQAWTRDEVLTQLASLRQHQHQGRRSPHKRLLVLLAIGRLAAEGTSALGWSTTAKKLADVIRDFGPPSSTSPMQSAAYPFTRLRSDRIWTLDHDVPDDNVRPLADHQVVGRLVPGLEKALTDPEIACAAARQLVEAEFPPTIAADVLIAVGLDPDAVLSAAARGAVPRRRQGTWPAAVLTAWDRKCAFCEFDGQLGAATVGVEAAHVRWFGFGGPDELDNGIALCSLHHKLFDHGVLGLSADLRILVSADFTSRTPTGRSVYDLHHCSLRPRPGTALPAAAHVAWHGAQVFKWPALVT